MRFAFTLSTASRIRRWFAGFWASVLALAWFCHGVMIAWSSPDERVLALLETALAVVIVFAASWPGLHARFGRRAG